MALVASLPLTDTERAAVLDRVVGAFARRDKPAGTLPAVFVVPPLPTVAGVSVTAHPPG